MLFPDWVHYLREQELIYLEQIFNIYMRSKNLDKLKILEIGSGDGYMASVLKKKSWNIIASDPNPRKPMKTYVYRMKGDNILFPNDYFDIIFSSNVLEHIYNLPQVFLEMKRVLKNTGIMIHTIPTSFCAVMTYLINPIAYIRNILLIPLKLMPISKLNPIYILYLWGHGTSKSVFHSFFNWRKSRWIKIFNENGLKVINSIRVQLLHSMHKVFPFKFMKLRRFFGNSCGSTDIWVLNKSRSLSNFSR